MEYSLILIKFLVLRFELKFIYLIRTEEEFKKGHLENALNIPYMFSTPEGDDILISD